ncbi:hypothetical protein IEQ34_021201 [Dendrobium chrysotoxum]|uniref:HVA22-like protein n=1 Tax=Dendrobium chrysotoxum TaxID=161865 RepID=A0AAV7FLV2_DENCH|nr:hypothetical protein IEQ34_021201 [Dendrobium chrysotoxum]
MAQIWTILSNLYSIAGPCVMLLYPLYASVEAIESPTKVDDEQWLAYWIIYSFLTLFEMVAEPLLSWIPIWYTIKLIFVTWLVLPQSRGSAFIYNKFVREQLRLYGYGGHKADKEGTKPSSPSKGRNKFLGLALSKKRKLKIRSTIFNLEEKKQRTIEGGASADEVRVCRICNVVCNSAKVFASHLAGEKHALNALKALGPNYPTMVPKVMAHLKQMKYAKKSVPNKIAGLGYTAAPKIVENFSCEVCKIECSSQETFNTHKMGKKHKANLQKLQEKITPKPSATSKKNISAGLDQTTNVEGVKKPSSTKEDLQTKKDKVVQGGAAKKAIMICSLCDVVCNSKAVYDSHISGKKHLALIKKQETQV